MRECYNTPEQVYRRAKARGMDLVAITDHDRIDGALSLADRPDVIVGCEVTGIFPRDGVRVHLGVLGLTEAQYRDIDRLRHDVMQLMPYLHQERLFVSLNHVASRINGRITGQHIAALLPWLNGMEVMNGSRLPSQNRTAQRIARANGKVPVAGSDSHTQRGIGRTWVEAPHARTREEFLIELHAGRVRVGGRQGNGFTMTSDILRITTALYREQARHFGARPAEPRRAAAMLALALGWPMVMLPIAIAMVHFGLEMRFNRFLLSDVARRPEIGLPELA
jgi:predicted metal-dependent phosphoesterase TrpH